jgi:hypothetical protein
MLEIVRHSPNNEDRIAERLRRLIAAQWPGIDASPDDRVGIYAGVQLNVDVDLIVEILLEEARPVAARARHDGSVAPPAATSAGLIVIEVKQQAREQFEFVGTDVYPRYGGVVSGRSVAAQLHDEVLAVKSQLRRYANDDVFVHEIAWLTDVPDAELSELPDFVVGRDADWSAMLQAAASRSLALLQPQTQSYRRSIQAFGTALRNRRTLPPADRAAVDRLTNAAVERSFDGIKSALGSKQIRLVGNAGSGKSSTIALLADYIARVRQERVLVLAYHHALCREIERLIRSVIGDDALFRRHVRVAPLVDFFAEEAEEIGGRLPRIDGTIDYPHLHDAFSALLEGRTPAQLRQDARTLAEIEPERFGFDYVCVDESQDCLDHERTLLRALWSPERTILADGMDQLVRRQTPCNWTSDVPGGIRATFELPHALRTTPNVAAFVTATARAMGLRRWNISPHDGLSGGRAIVLAHGYDERIVRELTDSLQTAQVALKDLLVCVPPSDMAECDGRRASRTAGQLRNWGYAVWDGCDEAVRHEPAATDEIRVVQYHSMRGLEGWCTLLVGLDDAYANRLLHPNLGAGDKRRPEDVAKAWVMMALTRAVQTVVITLNDADSEVAAWLREAVKASPDATAEWRD